MRIRKRYARLRLMICVLLSILMILSLSSCGGNGKPEDSESSLTDVADETYPDMDVEEYEDDSTMWVEAEEEPETIQPEVVILDKEWSAYGQYSEGLCPVQDIDTGLWGYVDKTGEYIIEPQFYEALPFCEGLAAVKDTSGLYSFINTSGEVEIDGGYYEIVSRFAGELSGFYDGFAVVKDDAEKDVLIDRQGNVVKELSENGRDIRQKCFVKRGDNFYRYTDPGHKKIFEVCDTQYNTLLTREDLMVFDSEYSSRCLFNYSEKYFIFDDLNYNNEGEGMYIVDNKGNIVFEQSMVPGMDNVHQTDRNHYVGVTDDYVVVRREINKIQTAAVFDFDGNMILDFKYKQVLPFGENIFVVQNNADFWGIVDEQDNELLPFSMEVMSITEGYFPFGIEDFDKYKRARDIGGLGFRTNYNKDNERAYYFDFASKQIEDSFLVANSFGTLVNAFDYKHETETGSIIYCVTAGSVSAFHNESAVIYNELGEEILRPELYFSEYMFSKNSGEVLPELFITAGVIPWPVSGEGGRLTSFAIIH